MTSPSIVHPSPPRLFTELLQLILALSLTLHDGPADRQRARHAFELVCRDWLYAAQRWRELEVTETGQIVALASTLACDGVLGAGVPVPDLGGGQPLPVAAKDAGGEVRTLRLCYDAGRWGSERALIRLFALTPNLTHLSIDLTASPAMSVLADPLLLALARLPSLRHFALKTGSRSPSLNLDIDALYKLAAGWPLLESFALERFYVSARLPPFVGAAPVFAAHGHLRKLQLHTHQFRNVYDSLLGSLPASLEEIEINGPRVYTDPAAARSIAACVGSVAPQLTRLTLSDSWHCTASEPISKGTFDAVLHQLDRLESLSISPVGFKTLSTLLPLRMLRELRVVQGHASSTGAVLGKELTALLQGAPTLKRIQISAEVVVQWSSKQRDEAMKVAKARGIILDC